MGKNRLLHTILIICASMALLTACTQTTSENKEEVRMTQEEKDRLQQQQEALALFLVNNFEDIHKIEFVDMTKGGFGVSDEIELIVNNDIRLFAILQNKYGDDDGYSFRYKKESKTLTTKPSNDIIAKDLDSIELSYYKD